MVLKYSDIVIIGNNYAKELLKSLLTVFIKGPIIRSKRVWSDNFLSLRSVWAKHWTISVKEIDCFCCLSTVWWAILSPPLPTCPRSGRSGPPGAGPWSGNAAAAEAPRSPAAPYWEWRCLRWPRCCRRVMLPLERRWRTRGVGDD